MVRRKPIDPRNNSSNGSRPHLTAHQGKIISIQFCHHYLKTFAILQCDFYHDSLQIRTPLLLWADAVCINQADKEEKEAQVQLMRRIYTRADLGDAEGDFDDVATVLNALMHVVKTTAVYEQIDYERYGNFGLPAYTDQKWESWRRFLVRPWFRRVWIMQEYALASHVSMMYGTLHLHGEALPGLIPEIIKPNITPNILPGADSYT